MLTNVIAHNGVQSNYVTLTNGMGHCGESIDLEEGTGALAKLGIVAGAYKNHPVVIGGNFSNFANGDSFDINGITVLMTTAGGLDQAGAVATINSYTLATGVVAYRAGTKIQLASLYGQPWTISGSNAAKMGFNPGLYGGSPTNIELSLNKTLANLRWQMAVQQLEQFATPFLLNDQLGTGNYDGQTELTTISFTVGYEHPDQVATADELNDGAMLYGTAAVKRAVARALTSSNTSNCNVFDPTLDTRGAYAVRPNPIRVMSVTADGIDIPANLATIEGNISVTIISFAG
jgi:ribosomal protein L29